MEDGNVYVYNFSELREEVKNVETQMSELVSMYNENNELIVGSLIDITEVQTGQLVSGMLICGLLGIIIGICFVNIFKSR